MALSLVAVVLVPLVIIEAPSSRLKARKDTRSSKPLGVQFCDDPIGGNGKRLRPLTRKLASDDRPPSSAQLYVATHSLHKILSSLHFRFFKEAAPNV
jgi:hypothetical protein